MRSRNQKAELCQFSILTPWEIDIEDAPINRYCSDLIQANQQEPISKIRKKIINPPTKKRAVSNCINHKNENQPLISEKSKYNKTQQQFLNENLANRQVMILTNNRTQRTEKKRQIGERCPLQELKQLSVKNFVIEGQQKIHGKDKGKKRESSYIMKQKFNQLRRSMKSITHLKENGNLKVVRYE